MAQSIGKTASTVNAEDPEYQQRPIMLGAVAVTAGTDVRIEYDDNIYAEPDNPVDDIVFHAAPFLSAKYSAGSIGFRADASADIRRYADHTTEDAEAYGFLGEIAWRPSATERLIATASWDRAIEDRGATEARENIAIGPRIYQILVGDLRYRRVGRRVLLDAEVEARKINAVAAIDADRDYSSYAGRATAGLRVSGSMFVTATGFVNKRDYRIAQFPNGYYRNSTTYGGRLGVDFEPMGKLSGDLSVGVFRFDPKDPGVSGRTGLSVAGSLIFRPTRRNAIILEASNGDVATFRSGATARTDTIVDLTVQQEIRHNLLAKVGGGFRQSKFIGSGVKEKTFQALGEVEYLVSRNFSIAAGVRYGDRTSDEKFKEFNRFNGWLELRFSF